MPELPEVETIRRQLEPLMRGARITHVLLRRKDLRRPFPPAFASRLEGRRIRSVDRRGKYLLLTLDSGDTLLMHLGMSGSFRISRHSKRRISAAAAPDERHDHVVFTLSNGVTVTFNDPRRFGVMDLLGDGPGASQVFAALGPEPLEASFIPATLARALTGKRVALKVALLDQRVVAGLGNIYASEALHRAGLSPLRRASTLATAAGRPTPRAVRLTAAIKTVLREAIARKAHPYVAGRFRVYDRHAEPCRTPGCRGTIRQIPQAGRSTFYCPTCQR
ncbi:MAG: bifunctional DNA-formamidopyrimidine glycosylase/DNA-(apurinic or apyrimidinic site) lyase [Acidobacteriota bacterium]